MPLREPPDLADAVHAAFDEALPAPARVDRHDDDVVHGRQRLLERCQRTEGVDGQSGPDVEGAEVGDGLVEMGHGFGMHRDRVRARLRVGPDVFGSVLDHQVGVERQVRAAPDRRDHHRPEGQVGDVVPVHDVEVQPVRPGIFHRPDLLRQTGEVGGEKRRGEPHPDPRLYRLRVSTIRSVRLTLAPAAGTWSTTMPAGTPR